MTDLLIALFNLVILDLILGGDNAVVIGMAAHRLPGPQRKRAILLGGALAVVLRAALTAVASLLLEIPLLQLIGGLVLVWITYRLVTPSNNGDLDEASDEEISMAHAIRLIIIADVTMSTDNVLAVGAVARGDIPLLIIGLTMSMAVVMLGGAVVSVLLNKLAWLTYVGAAVLVVVAGEMVAEDRWLLSHHIFPEEWWLRWVISLVLAAVVGLALWVRHLVHERREARRRQKEPVGSVPSSRQQTGRPNEAEQE